MIGFRTPSLLILMATLTACAHYDPYLDPVAKADGQGHSPLRARALSDALKTDLIKKANALTNEDNATTVALAGALGLGAYKLATGGGHQVVALAAGSGALYGVSQALYDQKRVTMIHQTVNSLLCLDGAYLGVDPDRGEDIAKAIIELDEPLWKAQFKMQYDAARKGMAVLAEQYTTNIQLMISSLNQRIAEGQLGPTERYTLITGSLSGLGLPPLNTEAIKNAGVVKEGTKQFVQVSGERVELSDPRKLRLDALIDEFSDWYTLAGQRINDVEVKVAQCRSTALPPTIPEVAAGEIVDISNTPKTLKITNSTGNLGASTSPNAPVTAKIVIEQKDYFVEITKKEGAKKGDEGAVYVTDFGKNEAVVTIKVKVD